MIVPEPDDEVTYRAADGVRHGIVVGVDPTAGVDVLVPGLEEPELVPFDRIVATIRFGAQPSQT